MKTGSNIRLRSDGRYEARYVKDRDSNGKIIYGYCYGKTYQEAEEKRERQLAKHSENKIRQMNLLILGAGVQGLEFYDIAKSLRIFSKISFLDDKLERDNVIGKWSEAEKLVEEYPVAIVAVADSNTRRLWTTKIQRMGYVVPTLVHPTAYVPEGIEIGVGSVICARTTISPGVSIGQGSIISSGSIVPKSTNIPEWAYFEIDTCIENYQENYI